MFGVVAAGFAAAWYGVPAGVAAKSSRYLYGSERDVPQEPVAIVLGARVYPDGTLSPVLQSRVDAGIELYKSGKVKKLLMSGDNSTSHYNEPTAMKRYAVAHGVPAQDVIRDFAGFHTYDTCYRAKYVFGITNAVFVSQAFHLPRAVYLARQLGIDAVGYVAPDDMSPADLDTLVMRERLATRGALVDLSLHRPARYPGPPEPGAITGTDPNS
jgi:SanA protein